MEEENRTILGYDPFKTRLRGATFGAIVGGTLGYAGGEVVYVTNDLLIGYEHQMPPLVTAALGAIAVGIAYGKLVADKEKSDLETK